MRIEIRRALRQRTGWWCVVCTLLLSACMDDQADPLATAVAPETYGAILFSEGLATLPILLTDNGMALEGAVEAEAWWESWKMEEAEGAELRSQLRLLMAQRLLPVLGTAGVSDLLERNAQSLSAVGSVGEIVQTSAIASAMNRARELHTEARTALLLGEPETALLLGLETADVLWTVSPQQVATDLLDKATRALRRNEDSGTYSLEELIRIRRLMFGASEALEEGDYPRAIRRAYYACQLLGADPP